MPVNTRSLVRSRHTVAQKQLSASERRLNMEDAFCLKYPWELCGRVLLIDDIYTTGTTLNEAAKCLKKGGVRKVHFLTISIGQVI